MCVCAQVRGVSCCLGARAKQFAAVRGRRASARKDKGVCTADVGTKENNEKEAAPRGKMRQMQVNREGKKGKRATEKGWRHLWGVASLFFFSCAAFVPFFLKKGLVTADRPRFFFFLV